MTDAATPVDRASSLPLWAQVEHDLRRRLEQGEFETCFPTDIALTEQYGVSRHTIRHAIAELNRTGVLRRQRGRGTVVDQAEFEQSLGSLYSLFRSIESSGVEQRSRLLGRRLDDDPRARHEMDLQPDDAMVFIERLRLAGDSPLAIDRAWLPEAIGRPLLEADFAHTALYDELERIGQRRPNEGWERIAPGIPTGDERRLLELGRTATVFSVERLGRVDGRPIEWRHTVIRGDRYRFVADWSTGAARALRLTAIEPS